MLISYSMYVSITVLILCVGMLTWNSSKLSPVPSCSRWPLDLLPWLESSFCAKKPCVGCVHVSFRSVSLWWLADSPLLTPGCRAPSCVSQRSGQETIRAHTCVEPRTEKPLCCLLDLLLKPQTNLFSRKQCLAPLMSTGLSVGIMLSRKERAWRGVTGVPWSPPLPARSQGSPSQSQCEGWKGLEGLDFCPENKCLPAE